MRQQPSDQPPVVLLLQELADCLLATSEDPSSTQGTEGDKLASKLRNVLHMLITHCVEGGAIAAASTSSLSLARAQQNVHTMPALCVAGSDTECVDILAVAQSAVKRYPEVFRNENCKSVVCMLRLLVTLYPDPKSR